MSEKPAPLECLSVIIPARDEDGCIAATIRNLYGDLTHQGIRHEIVVVDDGSADSTWKILQNERANIPTLRAIQNPAPHGFGRAIVYGLNAMSGHAAVIMMADDSDDSRDVVRYWQKLQEGYYLAQQASWRGKTSHPGNGQSLSLHLSVHLAREVFHPRRLSQDAAESARKERPDH